MAHPAAMISEPRPRLATDLFALRLFLVALLVGVSASQARRSRGAASGRAREEGGRASLPRRQSRRAGQAARSLACLRLLPSWAVPPLTSPELDAKNRGRRSWERWSSAQREERVSLACGVDRGRPGQI